jgi:hypothetical protein
MEISIDLWGGSAWFVCGENMSVNCSNSVGREKEGEGRF